MRGAETVVIRRMAQGVDWQGDPVGTVTEYELKQCQLWPRESNEDVGM